MFLKSSLVRAMGGSHYDHLNEAVQGMNLAIVRWEEEIDRANETEVAQARNELRRALEAHHTLGTHSPLNGSALPNAAQDLMARVEARLAALGAA